MIVKRGHWVFKLPYFKRFTAMTWAPFVYLNVDIADKLSKPEIDLLLAHEQVHVEQQSNVGNYRFLIVYFWKWLKNVFKYGFTMKAYFAIDWEREAYVTITPGYLTYLGHEDLDSNPFEA